MVLLVLPPVQHMWVHVVRRMYTHECLPFPFPLRPIPSPSSPSLSFPPLSSPSPTKAIVIVVTVAFVQEYRSEKSLEALTQL